MTWAPKLGDADLPEGLKSFKNNEIQLANGHIAYYHHGEQVWYCLNPVNGARYPMPKEWSPL